MKLVNLDENNRFLYSDQLAVGDCVSIEVYHASRCIMPDVKENYSGIVYDISDSSIVVAVLEIQYYAKNIVYKSIAFSQIADKTARIYNLSKED